METAGSESVLLSVEQWNCNFYIGVPGRWHYYHLRQKFCLWTMLLGNRIDFSGDSRGSRCGSDEGKADFEVDNKEKMR